MTTPNTPNTPNTCPEAWHGGLEAGLLVECVNAYRHRGWHKSADGSVRWGGKLMPEEHTLANALRDKFEATS